MSQNEIIGIINKYCSRIICILHSQNPMNLTKDDYELFDSIGEKAKIGYFKLNEQDRIRIENFLYKGCNSYADDRFREGKAFDLGTGTECIEKYLQLMAKHLGRKSMYELPEILIDIKDLIKIRLEMIGLTSALDQSIFLDNSRLRKDITKYKRGLQDIYHEIRDQRNELNEELKGIEERKADKYKDIIAIISIFSGVILTFAGAFSFSSAVLENINQANFPKLMIAVLLIILFLLTLFIGLFWFTYGIVYEKPFYNIQEPLDKETKEKKKKIKHYKRSLFVPLIMLYIAVIIIVLSLIFRFHEDLLKDTGASAPEESQSDVSITYETQPEDTPNESSISSEQESSLMLE